MALAGTLPGSFAWNAEMEEQTVTAEETLNAWHNSFIPRTDIGIPFTPGVVAGVAYTNGPTTLTPAKPLDTNIPGSLVPIQQTTTTQPAAAAPFNKGVLLAGVLILWWFFK